MVMISVINLAVRLFVVLGIFALVHQPGDYLLYAGLMSVGAIVAGLAGMVTAIAMFKLKPVRLTWRGIWETLEEGWTLFLSRASVSLYTAGNAFILGMLTNHTVVGYYSAAEKIVLAVSGLMGPIAQAVYPRFSKLASESKVMALQWGRRMLVLMGALSLALSIALFAAAPLVVHLMLGPGYEPSIAVMRILAAWIFINGITNVWGIQIMLPFGYDRAFFVILFLAGGINTVSYTHLTLPTIYSV